LFVHAFMAPHDPYVFPKSSSNHPQWTRCDGMGRPVDDSWFVRSMGPSPSSIPRDAAMGADGVRSALAPGPVGIGQLFGGDVVLIVARPLVQSDRRHGSREVAYRRHRPYLVWETPVPSGVPPPPTSVHARAGKSQRNGRDRETETQRAHPSPILTNTDPNQVVQPPPRGENLPLTRTPTTGTAETPRAREHRAGDRPRNDFAAAALFCSLRLAFLPGRAHCYLHGAALAWFPFDARGLCAVGAAVETGEGSEGAPGFRAVCVPVCGLAWPGHLHALA
jgi:hypothetical protein